MNGFESKVLNFIQKSGMLTAKDKVVVGFSGGADSTALLTVLNELKGLLKIELYAVHVNHLIREEAGDDAEFSRDFCNLRGIPFHLVEKDVPKEAGRLKMTEEEAGRKIRYDAMKEYLEELGGGCIAVAHHKNDAAETLLMNLFRGTGLHGAGGIRPVRDNIIRPLLCVSRQEIEDYLGQKGISFCTDVTNNENIHTRNIIRNKLIPMVTEEINSAAVENMARAAASFDKADEYIRKMSGLSFDRCVTKTDGEVVIDAAILRSEDEIIKENVVLRCFEALVTGRKDLTRAHVDAVVRLVDDDRGTAVVCLPYELEAVRSYDRLTIGRCRKDKAPPSEISFALSEGEREEIDIPGLGRVVLTVEAYNKEEDIPVGSYTKWFDYDRIQTAVFRTRRQGDYLYIEQKGELHRKDLFKLMTDEKIPAPERDGIYVLADGDNVLWLPGSRINAAYKISGNIRRILAVSIINGGNTNG